MDTLSNSYIEVKKGKRNENNHALRKFKYIGNSLYCVLEFMNVYAPEEVLF